MRSIKPGRGPSFMGGIGAVFVGLFGVLWTVMASSMGAPGAMGAFGVLFILFAAGMALYHLYNATAKNRLTVLDITENGEENDPLNERFGEKRFCPYCGAKLPLDARFCPGCGKETPHE